MRHDCSQFTAVNTSDYKRSFIAEKLQKDDVHCEVKATPKRLILLSHRPFQMCPSLVSSRKCKDGARWFCQKYL